jgi:hypothetical protein
VSLSEASFPADVTKRVPGELAIALDTTSESKGPPKLAFTTCAPCWRAYANAFAIAQNSPKPSASNTRSGMSLTFQLTPATP